MPEQDPVLEARNQIRTRNQTQSPAWVPWQVVSGSALSKPRTERLWSPGEEDHGAAGLLPSAHAVEQGLLKRC